MSLALYSRSLGEGPPVLLLHGLFGSGGNLGALARHLQGDYTAWMLDLPSHGRSQWLPQASLEGMAEAVSDWLVKQGWDSVHLVGHSLGGKVAMQLALARPARVRSLVVADIAPVRYPHRHQQVFAALAAVVREGCQSREQAHAVMARHLQEEEVIQFLLSSLRHEGSGTMAWRFDWQGLESAYPHLVCAPVPVAAYAGPVLFIKGGDSDYIQDAHWPTIRELFPAAGIKILAGCGHWLHAQKPELFNATVSRFLDKVE